MINYKQPLISGDWRRARMFTLWLPLGETARFCFSEQSLNRDADFNVTQLEDHNFLNANINPTESFKLEDGTIMTHQQFLDIVQSFYLDVASKRDTPAVEDFATLEQPYLSIVIPKKI